jgi:hypothetical protein
MNNQSFSDRVKEMQIETQGRMEEYRERAKRRVPSRFFQTVLDILSFSLAWYFFNWQLALIIFLILWSKYMRIAEDE